MQVNGKALVFALVAFGATACSMAAGESPAAETLPAETTGEESSTTKSARVPNTLAGDKAADEKAHDASSSKACRPEPPASLPDTKPIVHTELDDKGRPSVFECFEGCGASCNLQNKEEDEVAVCQDSACDGEAPTHRVVQYQRIAGSAGAFCSWHDRCYYECGKRFEVDDPDRYSECTRWCDFGCVNPDAWDQSFEEGRYDSDTAPKTILGSVLLLVTGDDEDRTDYISATKSTGPTPADRSEWNTHLYCVTQATTALGSNPIADMGWKAKSRITFSAPTNNAEPWSPGTCAEKRPDLARATP